MKHKIDTNIIIKASAEKVWEVLIDFKSYSDWNPFILQASGNISEGEKLKIKVQPVGQKAAIFTPKIQDVRRGKYLSWLGSLPIPGLFVGKHIFEIQPHADGILFSHREEFSGLLIPMLGGMLRSTESGFKLMNQALKDRVEAE